MVVFSLFGAGCSKEGTNTSPSKQADIDQSNDLFPERQSLPALFICVQSGKRLVAPGNKNHFLDKESGELYWRAMACHNPQCKAPSTTNAPFLFITPDPRVYLKADGSIGHDNTRAMKAAKTRPPIACPQCLKNRNLKKESREQKEKYVSWVKPHILPKTAQHISELEIKSKRQKP